MRWNSSTDVAACFLCLAGPHVVYGIAAFIFGEGYGGCRNGDFLCLPAGVEQTDDRVSVRFPLGEHLLVAGIEHSFRGDRILVDSKDFGVLQLFLQIRLVEVRYATLNAATGRVHGKTAARHTSREFVAFLQEVVSLCSPLQQIHIILDQSIVSARSPAATAPGGQSTSPTYGRARRQHRMRQPTIGYGGPRPA